MYPQVVTAVEYNMASPQMLPSPMGQQLPSIRTIFETLDGRSNGRRHSTHGSQSFTNGQNAYPQAGFHNADAARDDRYFTANQYAPERGASPYDPRDSQYAATIADRITYAERQPYPSPPKSRRRRDTNGSRLEESLPLSQHERYTSGVRNGMAVQSGYAGTVQRRPSRDRDLPASSYNTPPPSTPQGSVSPTRDPSPGDGRASPNYHMHRLSAPIRDHVSHLARPERLSVEEPPRSGYDHQPENHERHRQCVDYGQYPKSMHPRQYPQPVHPEQYPQRRNQEQQRQPGSHGQYGQPVNHEQYRASHGYARREPHQQAAPYAAQPPPGVHWQAVYQVPAGHSPFTMLDASSSLTAPNGHVLSMQGARYASSRHIMVPLVEVEPSRTNRSQRRGNLPKHATNTFKDWIHKHRGAPYPSEEQKQAWSEEFGLTISQISNWYINARRRILPPKAKGTNNDRPSEAHDDHADDDDDNETGEGPSGSRR